MSTREDLADVIISVMNDYDVEENSEFVWALVDELASIFDLEDEEVVSEDPFYD